MESKRGNRKNQTRPELFEGYFGKEEGKGEKCLSAALGNTPKALRLGFPSALTESHCGVEAGVVLLRPRSEARGARPCRGSRRAGFLGEGCAQPSPHILAEYRQFWVSPLADRSLPTEGLRARRQRSNRGTEVFFPARADPPSCPGEHSPVPPSAPGRAALPTPGGSERSGRGAVPLTARPGLAIPAAGPGGCRNPSPAALRSPLPDALLCPRTFPISWLINY